jgi:HlyD family secretion protein
MGHKVNISDIEIIEPNKNLAPQMAPASSPAPAPKNMGYSRYLVQGFIGLFLLVIVIAGWVGSMKIQGAVIASGSIVVEGKPKTLQHLDGGIIGEILVQNGSVVETGDVVLKLDPTEIDANRTIVEKRMFVALARSARLKSTRDGSAKIDWPTQLIDVADRPDVAEVMSGQGKLFRARKNSLNGQIGQLRQRVGQSAEQISGIEELIDSKRVQLGLISQELDGLRELLAKGFVSKTRVLALEREESRLNGEIDTLRSDIARTRSLISETRIQIIQLQKDNEAATLTELREVESELSDLNEQLTTASDKRFRVDVTSPVAGIVHDLSATTIGGVIRPGDPIMQIIPINNRLLVESRVLPVDIDQVFPGQPATIRMSAFNQRTTQELNGFVTKLSANSLIDQATGISYFNVIIEVSDEELEKLGNLVLVPGMPAEAFIQTKSRRVLSYMFKPFSDQLSRAFRED